MNAIVAAAALPVAAVVLAGLLRAGVGGRLVAAPSSERWHRRETPIFGGVGIFLGFLVGLGAAVAVGAVEATAGLGGIVAGCTILFLAGLADDILTLNPLAKLALQIAAAATVLASGLTVEIIANDLLATAIGLLWLVGITNAFNLLDNMDGLAASLATIACAYFAVDAATGESNRLVLVVALALAFACAGFLPYNLRPGRPAAIFMGDSGSQLLGFALAALALSASWKAAGTTVATMLLPLLILAVPILDTTLVTVMRLLERRPVTHGGRDHSSHRLVYHGLSETKAVILLAAVATAVGATGVAYNVLDRPRLTVVAVLVTFVLLVQFASALADLDERYVRDGTRVDVSLRRLFFQPRRILEVVVDFGSMCTAFFAAYLLQVGGLGTPNQKAVFLAAVPILLGSRYVAFVAAGIYRRVWRFAGSRDLVALAAATFASAPLALGVLAATRDLGDFPVEVFVLDAFLCVVLVGASRLALRVAPRRGEAASTRRCVLIVGAGRAGRSLARELRETPGTRVAGFLDDNERIRRRRIQGIPVVGSLGDAATVLASTPVDEVLVTIPDASPARLGRVVAACRSHGVPCLLTTRATTDASTSIGEPVSE